MEFNTTEDFFLHHQEILMDTYDQLSCNGRFFPTDLYTSCIINRALSINEAYIRLAKSNNYIAASTYIRMQMDNCMWTYAIVLVKDVLGLINHFISGKDLYKFKDKRRNNLYEKYLVQEINKHVKNFKTAYDFYNKDIHLSYKHFIMANNMIGNTMNLAFNTQNFYSNEEIKSYNDNMRIFNRFLTRLLLLAWLPYKKEQLELMDQLHEEQNLSYNEIIQDIIKDYPNISQILYHKS